MSEREPISTPQQCDAFFDRLVRDVESQGLLEHFDTPKGMPYTHSLPPHLKRVLDGQLSGTIHFIGDEPYTPLTTQLMMHEVPLHPQQIGLKSTSIRKAIAAYMPDEAFASYLRYFSNTLDDPRHHAALHHSLETVLREQSDKPTLSRQNLREIATHEPHEHLLHALPRGTYMGHLSHYPDLLAALAIYHAAHGSYIREMKAAVERAPLTPEERSTAYKTLSSNSFGQFDHFLLFTSILPLTMYFYEKEPVQSACPVAHIPAPQVQEATSEATWNYPVDHARMKESIGKAWEFFSRKQLMVRRYNECGEPPAEHAPSVAQMVCPAKNHILAAQKNQTLETLYDHLLAHPKLEVRRMAEAAAEKLQNEKAAGRR